MSHLEESRPRPSEGGGRWGGSREGILPGARPLVLCTEQVADQLASVLPGQPHVGQLHGAGADGKAEHELVPQVTGDQVDLFGAVYSFQKGFIQLVTLERQREKGVPGSGPRGLGLQLSTTHGQQSVGPLQTTLKRLPCLPPFIYDGEKFK